MARSQFYILGLVLLFIVFSSFLEYFVEMLYPKSVFVDIHPKIMENESYVKCLLQTYYKDFMFFSNTKVIIYAEGYRDVNVKLNIECPNGIFINKRIAPYRIFHIKVINQTAKEIISNRDLNYDVYCVRKCYIDLSSYKESFDNTIKPLNVTFYIDICYHFNRYFTILHTDSLSISINDTKIILDVNGTKYYLNRYFPCEKIFLRIYENYSFIFSNFYENVSGSSIPPTFFNETIYVGEIETGSEIELYELIYFENSIPLEYLYKEFWPLPFSCSGNEVNVTIPLDGSNKYVLYLVDEKYLSIYRNLHSITAPYIIDNNTFSNLYLVGCEYKDKYLFFNVTYPEFYLFLKRLIII